MKEAYISEEVAALLQQKGFHEPCTGLNKILCENGKKPLLLITQQKATDWLREVHKLHAYTFFVETWHFEVQKLDGDWTLSKGGYCSHKEAMDAAICRGLELIQ